MRHWFVRRVVPAVLVIGVLGGCGSAPAKSASPFPPRPADIDIERLDPCALLTPQQQAEFKVDVGQPGTAEVGGVATRACGWGSVDSPFDYSVQFLPQAAADSVGAPGTAVGSIAGYGTVQTTERVGSFPLCEIYIDVSDAHMIRIQVQTVNQLPGGRPYAVSETCGQATTAAGYALQNARKQSV